MSPGPHHSGHADAAEPVQKRLPADKEQTAGGMCKHT